MKWAPAADLKQELDRQVAALLGPKTEADMQKPDAKKKKAKVRASVLGSPLDAGSLPHTRRKLRRQDTEALMRDGLEAKRPF